MNKLSFWQILPIGLMLFSSFFGAGNLIFPPSLGQSAGTSYFIASLGFCVTGVGMPLLGIIAMAYTRSDNPNVIGNRVHPLFAKIFILINVLTIGPFFAIPRTAAVSFDVGIRSFLPPEYYTIGLLLYSLFFFVLTYFLSVNPSKLVDWLGKVLTPLLLLSLAVLIFYTMAYPIGEAQPPLNSYIDAPFFSGFQEGYNTMDLLGAMLFGATVITAIRYSGVTNDKQITKVCMIAGFIAAFFLAIIYIALAYAGATSVTLLGISQNGGIALADISRHYLGTGGNIVLCLIIFFACLTTSIGLTAASASYFTKFCNEKVQYQRFIVAVCLFSFFVANVGLSKIISLSIPVLYILYPILIVLVILSLSSGLFNHDQKIYRSALVFTTFFALIDGIKVAGVNLGSFDVLLSTYIPFFTIGLGWFVPTIIGIVIGIIWKLLAKH